MRAAADGWIAFLNREGEELARLRPTLPRAVLRAHLRDRLLERYRFPLRTFVRALVVGERRIDALARADGVRVLPREPRFLELWPEGLTREAAALTGPLLVPSARPLHPGSVLTMAIELDDPTRYALEGPGLLARALEARVEVAVEP